MGNDATVLSILMGFALISGLGFILNVITGFYLDAMFTSVIFIIALILIRSIAIRMGLEIDEDSDE